MFAEITGEDAKSATNTNDASAIESNKCDNTPPLEEKPEIGTEANQEKFVEEDKNKFAYSDTQKPESNDAQDLNFTSSVNEIEFNDQALELKNENEVEAEVDLTNVGLEETNLLDINEADYEQGTDLKSVDLTDVDEESSIALAAPENIEEVNLSSEDSNEVPHVIDESLHEDVFLQPDHEAANYKIIIKENGVGKELRVLKQASEKDVIEIFIEEAEEEIEKISRNLPAWRDDSQNEEALITTRRSFHTLKGSGRLVGAEIMGEFAWHFERILNKVIENSIQVTPELHALLSQSVECLQQLLTQLKIGNIPASDIQALIDSAQRFHKSEKEIVKSVDDDIENTKFEIQAASSNDHVEGIVEADNSSEALQAQIKEIEDNIVASSNEDFDAELNAIFINEARQHIQTLEKIIKAHETERIISVDEKMTHALHTLFGSARTAEVDAIIKICGPLEEFCHECSQQNQQIQGQQYDVVAACVENFNEVISKIDKNHNQIDVDAKLLQQAVALKCVVIPVLDEVVFTAVQDKESNLEKTQLITLKDSAIFDEPDLESADLFEDKDADLTEIFLEEASDILSTCNECLERWQKNSDDESSVSEFRRQLHTLKGSARMAAYSNIGDFSHAIESLVNPITEGLLEATDSIFTLLQRCLDTLHEMIEEAISKRPVYPASGLIAEIQNARGDDGSFEGLSTNIEQTVTEPVGAKEIEEEKVVSKPVVKIPVLRSIVGQEDQTNVQPVVSPQQAIRLQADMLDNLVNNAGEINIFQARLEQTSSKYISSINELDQVVNRLREQLRNLELETETQILSRHAHDNPNLDDFDPLELDRYSNIQQLSRSLAESVNDLLSVKELLYDQVRESETLLLQQHRISTDLQEGLMRTRMVQFNQLVPRMQRIVRQTARELDKDAELKVNGAETEIDSSILNRVVAPLEHLIRNAISHGIDRRQGTTFSNR